MARSWPIKLLYSNNRRDGTLRDMYDYVDVTNRQRHSIFPEALQRALLRICDRFSNRRIDQSEMNEIVSSLSQLPAGAYRRAEREIVVKANLYRWYEPKRSSRSRILGLIQPPKTDQIFLFETPGLEYLYLFHGDGHLREAALGKINGPLGSAFFFNTIAYRLNDWVEPVRQAAQGCAARAFPQTSAEVVAEAVFVLLERMRHWQRWDKGFTILKQTLERPDVIERLAALIETSAVGSPSRVLRYILSNDKMDGYLLHLSQKALQPVVRAVALKTLINGYASWPNGFKYEWVNKALGERKRVVAFRTRPLVRLAPVELLIAQGATDKAAIVRRVAADGLILHRKTVSNLDELTSLFAQDKTSAVRERAVFIIRDRAGEFS
jgi:hypothetical protein